MLPCNGDTVKKYKHSGTLGDIIYGLAVVKELGQGEFYLHLQQINWIVKHYYNSQPDAFHDGRMTEKDFEFMKDFMSEQNYITKFDILQPDTEITHNLDRFRNLFVKHPGNYVDIYADSFYIPDSKKAELRNSPWLTVQNPRTISGKPYAVNRTARWGNPDSLVVWNDLREQGIMEQSFFVGLPQEHQEFVKFTGWKIDYVPTKTLKELAELIAGCEQFLGNQSVALSLAIGLGANFACEARPDLPLERNECYFPEHPNGDYF